MGVASTVPFLAFSAAAVATVPHQVNRGPCRVSIHVAPRMITAGDPAVVWGRLECAPDAQQPVNLLARVFGQPGFTSIAMASTDGGGFYELDLAGGVIDDNSHLRVTTPQADSSVATIRVSAQVTLNGPPDGSQLYTGPRNPVVFSGTVTPQDAGARVLLQRQNAQTGNSWRRIDEGTVQMDGSYSITHVFKVPGDANIRALVRSQRRNLASASNVLSYEISQTENPALTIVATPDPIDFGQPVAITGALAAGQGRAVTLLARNVHRGGYVAMGQVTTGAGGSYAFPAQTPVFSTFYRVVAKGGPSSAVLFEGVRDVLTAQASATTLMAGQSITFSGTVTPDHTGHVIYLERQDLNSSDFHVVAVGTVGAGSAYSITRRLYVPGTKVMRVFIPGGPENQGAASQPFTITVTPAPPSTLPPDGTSGGSSLPSSRQQ